MYFFRDRAASQSALNDLARAHRCIKEGDFDSARVALNNSPASRRDSLWRLASAKCYIGQNNPSQALATLDRIPQTIRPIEKFILIAEAYLLQNKTQEALTLLQKTQEEITLKFKIAQFSLKQFGEITKKIETIKALTNPEETTEVFDAVMNSIDHWTLKTAAYYFYQGQHHEALFYYKLVRDEFKSTESIANQALCQRCIGSFDTGLDYNARMG